MKTCVADALNDLRGSGSAQTFEYPFEFLALLLEASNIAHIYGSGNLFDMYPQHAHERLSLDEQAELLPQLLPLTDDPELRVSALWVFGKIHPEVAFEPVIDFAISRWTNLPEHDRHQAHDRSNLLFAIDNYVWVSEIRETLFERSDLAEKYRMFMRLLRQSYQESSEDLQETMDRLFTYELS